MNANKIPKAKDILLVLIVLAIVALMALYLTMPSAAQSVPVLVNPNFEEGFYLYSGINELQVPVGWTPWYIDGDKYKRPEFKPETVGIGAGRVFDGQFASKSFVRYAKHDGGLYQFVDDIREDEWYEFSCRFWQWSSSADNPDISTPPNGKASALVGVNPWGNAWPTDRTTIWGMEHLDTYDQWVESKVIFQGWRDGRVVVFTRGSSEYGVSHNDWYVDHCQLKEYIMEKQPPSTTLPEPETPVPTPWYVNCPTLGEIRSAVETVVAEREPVKWPR